MANVCLLPGKHPEDCGEEMNKDLEDMIDDVENISVQLTLMAYNIVVQRTSPELSDSLRKLEEEYLRCKVAICCSGDQMERTEINTERRAQSASPGLDHILKGLDLMSECIDKLALKAQLRQCDLIVCFSHPDKMASLDPTEDPWPSTGPSQGPNTGPSQGPNTGPSKGPNTGPSKGPNTEE